MRGEKITKIEQTLINCHMALLGLHPVPYALYDVNEYLVKHGESKYAKGLRKIEAKRVAAMRKEAK